MNDRPQAVAADRPEPAGLFDILKELRALPGPIRPLQFNSLITGAQYFPIYDLTRRFAKPGQKALDWGCGNGHFSYFLLHQGLNVRGFSLEADDNALAPHLKTRYADAYQMVEGDLSNPVHLPFDDASFDLVFSIGVLEHVRETGGTEQASLEEIVRVLRPGGHFICGMLPKKHSWIEFLVRNAFSKKHWHAFRYTRRDIEALMNDAGLDLVETGTHGFLPRNSWNSRWLKAMGNQQRLAQGFNVVDRGLAKGLSPIAQNFLFSAKRPS